jgi:dienelactone hydrolase
MSLVYDVPGTAEVVVRQDVPFSGELVMDLYTPPGAVGPLPAVVIVAGYPDEGFERKLGFRFKSMPSNVAWARLLATLGMMAVTYTNVAPARDLDLLLAHLRRREDVDPARIALWAASGNVPLALAALEQVRCAALLYGFMLDEGGVVSRASGSFGFVSPGFSMVDKPLFVARAGQDQFPGVRQSIDAFVAEALRRNLPLTFVNHPEGPHAFDVSDDSETSRSIVRQVLAFLQEHVGRV